MVRQPRPNAHPEICRCKPPLCLLLDPETHRLSTLGQAIGSWLLLVSYNSRPPILAKSYWIRIPVFTNLLLTRWASLEISGLWLLRLAVCVNEQLAVCMCYTTACYTAALLFICSFSAICQVHICLFYCPLQVGP